MVTAIIKYLTEKDDITWKDAVDFSPSETASYPENYSDLCYIYDPEGRLVSMSRNLVGIKSYVSKNPVRYVEIQQFEHDEGGIKIVFQNGYYWLGRWADYTVVKWALRNWRNLAGAELRMNGKSVGKIGYRNPALAESKSPRAGLAEAVDDPQDFKDVYYPGETEIRCGHITSWNGKRYPFKLMDTPDTALVQRGQVLAAKPG